MKNRVFIIGGAGHALSAAMIHAELAKVETEPFVVVARENIDEQPKEIQLLYSQMLDEVEKEKLTPIMHEIELRAKDMLPTLNNYSVRDLPKNRGRQKKPFNKYLWKK